MSEFITDRDLSSIGETSMAAYAGLTITDGGVNLNRSELPQAVTVAGALSTEGESSPIVYLSFVDGEMWSEKKQARTIELLQGRCKEKGVSVTFVTEKPESGKYSTVYVGAASVLKAYGADEDLSKQDYSDGVAYADTNTGLLGNKEYVIPQEVNEIAEQISNLTEIDLSLPSYQKEDYLMQNNDSIVYLEFVDESMWSKGKQARTIELLQGRCKEKGVSVTFVTEKPESGKYSTVYVGAASVLKAYGADEDLSKQDYRDGVAYADTDMGRFGDKEYILSQEYSAIAEQIKQLTAVDLTRPERNLSVDRLLKDEAETPIVYLSFVDGAMWSENKISKAIELLRNRCKEKGVSVTFVTEKPESGKYSTVYVGAASVLKAYGADEDLSKQDYSDGVAYANTPTRVYWGTKSMLFHKKSMK